MPEHVFVYGTLAPDDVRWTFAAPFVAQRRRATAPGRVFDTGHGYPAARFDLEGTIEGWLYELAAGREAEALEVLDDVEGVAAGTFRRVRVVAADAVEAWAYELGVDAVGLVDLDGRWPGV